MESKVYFANSRATCLEESLIRKTQRLFDKSGMNDIIEKDDIVALKMHMGEWGSTRVIRPQFVRAIVDKVKECGGKSFVTDTTAWYRGTRTTAVDYLETAAKNGYSQATLNAPIIIADGIKGIDGVKVKINGKQLKEVEIAKALFDSDVIIGITHFKGHVYSGFGGTIKNLGMGGGSKTGKLLQHGKSKPRVNERKCIACGICARYCPTGAITVTDKAKINEKICIGCGQCKSYCPQKAIDVSRTDSRELQTRMAEHLLGLIKIEKKMVYFNFLLDITPICDCPAWSDLPIAPDIGILASKDPVAIDKASLDLLVSAPGMPGSVAEEFNALKKGVDKLKKIHDIDCYYQIKIAEELGLGNADYELIELD